jgi:glycosyltransferase involved in cell wall biosynthesis
VLDTLAQQTLNKNDYEVIVVDNNSSDGTRDVAEKFCRQFDNIRYYVEAKQGSSHARNLGIQEARGQYVAFCDDDCVIPREWLLVAKEVIVKLSPAVFGGGFLALYDDPRPRWYQDRYGSSNLGNQARVLEREYIFGGNSFYRRTLLVELGGFDPTKGPVGTHMGYGEDVAPQVLMRSKMPGHVIYYDPRLNVYHLVRPEKMKLRWILKTRFLMGHDNFRALSLKQDSAVSHSTLWRQGIQTAMKFLIDITIRIMLRDRQRYPFFQNYIYERTSEYLADLGRLYARSRIGEKNYRGELRRLRRL